MTYYGGKDLAAAFRTVRENTVKIAEEIPENKYDFAPAPESRTIGKTLVHIALGSGFQEHIQRNKVTNMMTVNFPELMHETIALLKCEGERFAAFLEGLSETFLAETVTMPPGMQPPAKTRFEMLLGAKEHEMHHRGQLMTLQRMIGQVPHLTRQMQERLAQRAAQAAAVPAQK
jgi:uncharacterized damage-inducible protein DinB